MQTTPINSIRIRSFLTVLITLLMLGPAYAQKNAVTDKKAAQFISYYNAANADSLYTLFSDVAIEKIPLPALKIAIQQLKGGLGNLVKSEYYNYDQGAKIYIATFERSGPVLYINFDIADNVMGFFVSADQRDTPGTLTVKTHRAVLKGTLALPEVSKPVPVVLLIAGSGPTDRDGNSMLANGKPNYLLLLSDALKAKNIAVFRYDKRGVGQSTTTKPAAEITFNDMIDDAGAIIKTLQADKRFSKVIVAGHSEGSLIGMLAAEGEKADAFISLSGPGFPADLILKTQIKAGASAADYEKAVLIIDSVKAGNFTTQKMSTAFNSIFNTAVQPYLNSWMKYDPAKAISMLKVPVLIVQGTNDIQISVKDAETLKRAAPTAQLKLIPQMSHILKVGSADKQQNAATYTMPDLPLHPDLVPALVEFINSLK
ncbi:alpha/beta fold hydrolase [Mucilaginibacter calamicampi]|uniref:Alpha/beta fold hydrolase n=1 Tax=Mucilaginibacter calamicampi TaxID=1302352 RepID=A0ABW2YVQ2_9SPHI